MPENKAILVVVLQWIFSKVLEVGYFRSLEVYLFVSSRAFEWAYDELCTTILKFWPWWCVATDLLVAGGTKSRSWAAILGQRVSDTAGHRRYIGLSACTSKKALFWTPYYAVVIYADLFITRANPNKGLVGTPESFSTLCPGEDSGYKRRIACMTLWCISRCLLSARSLLVREDYSAAGIHFYCIYSITYRPTGPCLA